MKNRVQYSVAYLLKFLNIYQYYLWRCLTFDFVMICFRESRELKIQKALRGWFFLFPSMWQFILAKKMLDIVKNSLIRYKNIDLEYILLRIIHNFRILENNYTVFFNVELQWHLKGWKVNIHKTPTFCLVWEFSKRCLQSSFFHLQYLLLKLFYHITVNCWTSRVTKISTIIFWYINTVYAFYTNLCSKLLELSILFSNCFGLNALQGISYGHMNELPTIEAQ